MNKKFDELIELMAEQVSESDLIAAELLAKISSQIVVSRIEREMTQSEFAKFMGVSQGMISKWESEDYNFTIETLAKICEKLNLDIDISFKKHANKYLQQKTNIEKNWGCISSKPMSVLNTGVA